ncbi:MAG: hypothetical protein A07HR60_01815 [uncultured archaeon A07HR60]|nr:MAG: hypothetical protein A07HR60_01815 [uncultured archaeon A07HR60]
MEKLLKRGWKRWNIQTSHSVLGVGLRCRLNPALKGEASASSPSTSRYTCAEGSLGRL